MPRRRSRPDDPPPAFVPEKLGKRDLDVTVPAHLRVLPTETIENVNRTKHEMLDRWRVHNPRFQRRLKHYVAGSAVAFPLVTAMFSPTGFGSFALQILLSAGFGVLLAYARPTGLKAGLLTLAFGMLLLWTCGPPIVTYLALICTALLYLVIGFAIGAQEDLAASDGS